MELWTDVGLHLKPSDCARLMRVCAVLHTAGSVLLYRRLVLTGRQGRKCNIMLSSGEGHAPFYASLVHEVIFFAFDVASRHVNLPVFAKAIQSMTALHILRLNMSAENSRTLLSCMREEEYSLSSAQRYPRLSRVHLNSGPELALLVGQRDLTEFSLTAELTLDKILSVTQGLKGVGLVDLHLHLKAKTDEDEALGFIGRFCPSLQVLLLQKPGMDAKVSHHAYLEMHWADHNSWIRARGFSKPWKQERPCSS
jgi:hypothetical protein